MTLSWALHEATIGRRHTTVEDVATEKFDIKDGEGRPAASVSFDYLPSYVGDAVTELKNFVAQGLALPDGKTNFIKIDNLTLNIANGGGNAININAGMDTSTMIKGIKDMLAKKDTPEAQLVNDLVTNTNKANAV